MTTRNPLDDLPRRDPRDGILARAEGDISTAIGEVALKHSLTYAELIGILAQQIEKWAERQQRYDRGEGREAEDE